MYNFNVNSRDRTLKTPLHLASLYGWDAIVDTLIRTGADIITRDSLGRSSIHFAASGSSSNILRLLIATKPELVNDNDHKKRTPLHYCVYNKTKN